MTSITKHNKLIVYADDTTVLVSGRNLTETKQHCNDILNRFYLYFTLNKSSINPDKTKYMIYKPIYHSQKKRKCLFDTTRTQLLMDGIPLKQVSSIKFLGVKINDKLTWEDHKNLVYSKICKSIGLIYKCKKYMNEAECIKMYKTFIQPYFLYGIEIWGHALQNEQDILIKLQSKIIRIIFDTKRTGDAWYHNNGQIKPIKDLYSNSIKKLSMKHHYGKLPHHFSKNVMPDFNITQLDNKITRISLDHMYDYKNSTTASDTHLKLNCIKLWNTLPFTVKASPYTSSKDSIYKNLKEFN